MADKTETLSIIRVSVLFGLDSEHTPDPTNVGGKNIPTNVFLVFGNAEKCTVGS